jgi:hypothetical protein
VSRWIRLDVGFDDTEWVFSLSAESQLAWVKLLCYSKRDGIGGRVKAMSYAVAAKRWGVGAENVEKMIHAAKLDGAITETDGEWIVAGWEHYQQPDNTNSERQKRYRERQSQTPEVSAETVTDSNAVTVLHKPLPVSVTVSVSDSGEIDEIWNAYPKRDGLRKREGRGAIEARLLIEKIPYAELLEGTKRYAAHCRAKEPKYIMAAERFYDAENGLWRGEWKVEPVVKQQVRKAAYDV